MATITALQQQQRNRERVSVFLDEQFAFGLPAIVAAALRVGQALTADEIDDLQTRATRETAKQLAINYLAQRPRSSREIARYLHDKAFEQDVIDDVVARLTELALIDDAAFARYWVEQRESFKPRGRTALSYELRQKGVPRDIIEAAVDDVDEIDSARQAAAARADRLAHLPQEQFYARLGGFLQRRGFGYSVVRQVLDELWQAQAETQHDAEE